MIDNYGRNINYMRISVTELCNLRCRYCMPAEGIEKRSHEEMMSAEETIAAVKAAVSLGISKIRITGGEPLVKRGIVRLCEKIASVDGVNELCITTNGTMLDNFASDLKSAGVNRVNISLDTLDSRKFSYITRLGNIDDVFRGIDAAFEAGFDKVKINTVLMGGFNDDEIEAFVNLTKDRPLDVRFIELMPIGGGMNFERAGFISSEQILLKAPQLENLKLHDGVADMYRLPEAEGRVGLIKTISCGFCGECNKIRLTADGMLKPCLHSDQELCIKGRTVEEMKSIIKQAIYSKPEMRKTLDSDNPSMAGRDMNRIGG